MNSSNNDNDNTLTEFTKINDETDVKTWIKTDAVTDSYDRNGFRVTWIDWNSDFRNSDLQIEDIIVGYDHVSLEPFLESGKHGSAIGQHGETPYWQKLGVKHGHTITLKVFREGIDEILEISGKLLAQRFYSNTESKRALGPGGPPSISRDNFSSAWSGWYEKLVWKMSFILDGAWDYRKLDNKRELQEHDEHKKRIDYLTEKYPGVFADIVVLDWKKVRKNLLGKEIDEVDLEYREIGAKRAETVKQEAQIAWDKLHADLEKDMLPVFPIVEVDDRDSVTGKIIELPWIIPRNIINDLGHSFAVIGNRTEGYYFAQMSESVSVRKFYDCMYKYQSQVNPKLKERYQYVAKITGEPGLITYDGKPVTGLMVQIIAARAGDGEFFVDLQNSENEEKTIMFAGEEKINQFPPIKLSDSASPQEVIEAMINAVKLGYEESWKSLFATWKAYKYWENRIAFDPSYVPRSFFSTAWSNSRKLISDRLCDVRVDKIGRVHRIISKDVDVGLPDVDEVDAFVDHYELVEEENENRNDSVGKYRTFLDVNVRRRWTLQRLDEGPWRITTVQVI